MDPRRVATDVTGTQANNALKGVFAMRTNNVHRPRNGAPKGAVMIVVNGLTMPPTRMALPRTRTLHLRTRILLHVEWRTFVADVSVKETCAT